eukprot:2099127-Pyramimonas_sp.AAC.1
MPRAPTRARSPAASRIGLASSSRTVAARHSPPLRHRQWCPMLHYLQPQAAWAGDGPPHLPTGAETPVKYLLDTCELPDKYLLGTCWVLAAPA